jgi:hypothetical protein
MKMPPFSVYQNTYILALLGRCFSSTGGGTHNDLVMKREMSAAPDWMVEQMTKKRTRCNKQECNAASAPAWKTENNKGSLPHGPEVSYGIPFRWSASR